MKSFIICNVLHLLLMLPVVLAAQKNMCYSCHGKGSKTCKDELKECPDNKCLIMSEEFGGYGHVQYAVNKRCANNLNFNKMLRAYSAQDVWIKLNFQHCTGDKCNTGYYNMPNNDTEAKGILCPTCHALNTLKGCTAKKSSVCIEEDEVCVDFRGTFKPLGWVNIDLSMLGCMSKDACGLDSSMLIGMRMVKIEKNECYTPAPSYGKPAPSYEKPAPSPEKKKTGGLLGGILKLL